MTTRAPSRQMFWRTTVNTFSLVAGLTSAFDLMPGESKVKGMTIIRCVHSIDMFAPGIQAQFAWGTLVTPENMLVSNSPNPLTEEAGWLCWDAIRFSSASDDNIHRQYDTRAMRKFRSNEEELRILLRCETVSVDGQIASRVLLKLP